MRRRMRRTDQRGVVSLEFALAIPILMILVFATFTLGHAMYVRFHLAAAANRAARACALARLSAADCFNVAEQLAAGMNKYCNSQVEVGVTEVPVQLVHTRGLRVQMDCSFDGGLGQTYLRNNNIEVARFSVNALMPYSVPDP